MQCTFDPRSLCRNEAVVNFQFCIPHLNTPRGLAHMRDVAASGAMLVQSDIDHAIEQKTKIPEKDTQTTALEKMLETLDRVLEYESFAGKLVAKLDPSDWRFLDRTGSEQLRSEVLIYERAMDRTARVLKDISKMALNEKIVSLGRAQTELMVRILMGVVNDMNLSSEQIDEARSLLLDKMMKEANMGTRLKDHMQKELSGPPTIDGEVVE